MCDNCTRLEVENAALKEEIKRLKTIIRRMQKIAAAAQRLLKGVYGYLLRIYMVSGKVVKKPWGVPRARYAYHKGRYEVALAAMGHIYSAIKMLDSIAEDG